MTLLGKTFLVLRMASKFLIMVCSALCDERSLTCLYHSSLSLHSSHTSQFLVPQTLQTCFYFRVFTHAVLSAQNILT